MTISQHYSCHIIVIFGVAFSNRDETASVWLASHKQTAIDSKKHCQSAQNIKQTLLFAMEMFCRHKMPLAMDYTEPIRLEGTVWKGCPCHTCRDMDSQHTSGLMDRPEAR